MTSTSARSVDSANTDIVHRGESDAGPFMVRLCRLVEPVSIRPPQSPHLRPFTFFTSRARQQDGEAHLYLSMGFFDTLAHADRWAQAVRGRHPGAIATISPPEFRGGPDSTAPFVWADRQCLTDTQVLNILELRGAALERSDGAEPGGEQIELLRPEDTGTRLALKEAVARGAPIAFAVQLHWSAQPIDPGCVPDSPLLKAHTLYVVESRRSSRSCFFLRLGFFGDPASAREAAAHVRSSFASAAVVPVLEEEITRARAAHAGESEIPCLIQQRLDEAAHAAGPTVGGIASKRETGQRRRAAPGAETIERTLARLAEREMWNDPDVLSDTGVRHLKIEVQGRAPGTGLARHAGKH